MSLVQEQAAFLKDVADLIEFASSKGFVVTGGELYRTPEQQDIYIKTGRSKTRNSYHLRRCAIDLNFFVEENGQLKLIYDTERLKEVGAHWEGLTPGKNSWGGNWSSFKDVPHFERRS